MIVTTVSTAGEFINEFVAHGRQDQFSSDALRALFDFYEELSDDMGEDIPLDVIAICCDWGEYAEEELEENGICLDDHHFIKLDNGNFLVMEG